MSSEKLGGNVLITPTIFSRLLRGNVVKAKELTIPLNSGTVQISCDNVIIGNCNIDDTGRLLLSSIYCPSVLHYNTTTNYKTNIPCTLCEGGRGVPTLLNTSERNGQMVCALTLSLAIYRGIALPELDESERNAANTGAMIALLGLISGGQE